jgi:hypothetical protein
MSTSSLKIYNEDVDIDMPNVLNGVAQLGDLWDCQTSRALNTNLFMREFDADHVKVSPIQTMKYTLDHIVTTEDKLKRLNVGGELSLEFLAGQIKVAGSADFDDNEVKGRKFEKLTCHYYTEKFNIDVLPKAKEILNDQVVEQLINGQIKATHFVKRVVIGADIDASIKIESLNTKKVTDVKGA